MPTFRHSLIVLFWLSLILLASCTSQPGEGQTYPNDPLRNELRRRASDSFDHSNFPEAASLCRRGLFVCDSLGLPARARLPFYNTLAMVYTRFADYKSALRYSDMALEVLDDSTVIYQHFHTWNNRAKIFYYRGEDLKAWQCVRKAKQSLEGREDLESYYYKVLMIEGNILCRLNRFEGVAERLDSCESYFVAQNMQVEQHWIASIRGLLALRAEKDYAKSLSYLHQQPVLTGVQSADFCRLEHLREYYRTTDDAEGQLRVDEFLLAAKDSLLGSSAAMRVADMELQYRENMREVELANSRRHATFYSLIAVAAVIIAVLLAIIAFSHTRLIRRRRDMEVLSMQESLMAERVRNLRARISPHYLMNVLRQMIADGQQDIPNEKVQLLTQTLRSSLELSDHAVVCLKYEVDFVKDYLKLNPKRTSIEVEWQIDGLVDLWKTMVPSMIIQLPLENALKYAYDSSGTVLVSIQRSERNGAEGVAIVIEDFGRGISSTSGQPKGLGLTILTRTISFINMYNNNDPLDMQVTDKGLRGQGQGVKVEFFIPKSWKSPFQS